MSDINSGLLNDVLIVGNELSGKLNEIGVSNTFGRASEGKDDLISLIRMAIDGIDNIVDEKSYVSLTATNPYMLTGETTDVVAKLRNGVCRPLTNKNVIIGKSVFFDNGTTASHNDNWTTINSSASLTRLNDYSELKRKENATSFAWISKTLSVTDKITIEFDLKQATPSTSNKTYFTFRATGGDVKLGITKLYQNLADGEWHHYRFDVNGLTVTPIVDGVQRTTLYLTANFNYVQLDASEEAVHHFKNFVVYENINGVTDENGEFALYDISDDTIFTTTYETVSDTCTVEKCRFVDYAVKNKHNHNYFNQQGTDKVSIIEADDYKEFKTISTNAGNIYIGSSTGINFDVGDTWTITYDKLYIDGYNVAFQCYNGNTTVGINSTTLLAHNSDFQELKFVCDGSSIKAYVDGVYKTQTSYTSTGHSYLRININNNNGASQATFRAKNIRIK